MCMKSNGCVDLPGGFAIHENLGESLHRYIGVLPDCVIVVI